MTLLDIASLVILAFSGIISVALIWKGRGWSSVVTFLYLLSYLGMGLVLKALGQFNDLPYLALAIAIDAFFFYVFLNKGCRWMAILIGFDTVYTFVNIWLLQGGINTLDLAYGHVGIAVSLLLLFVGAGRGLTSRGVSNGDSTNINWSSLVRPLSAGKRAKG
jgi:hypothetical protein